MSGSVGGVLPTIAEGMINDKFLPMAAGHVRIKLQFYFLREYDNRLMGAEESLLRQLFNCNSVVLKYNLSCIRSVPILRTPKREQNEICMLNREQ